MDTETTTDHNQQLLDALPGDLRRIAEVVGLEATVRIAAAFRGTTLYVPGMDDLTRQFRDRKIQTAYDRGDSVKLLAARHRMSERGIRRVLGKPSEPDHPLVEVFLEAGTFL